MRPLRLRGALWAALLLALGACDRAQPIVELWSDRAELAAHVETFNAAGGPVKVELTYVAHPAQELLRGAEAPDLVFGSWLASPELERLLLPLDRNLQDQVADASFFPGLSAADQPTAGGLRCRSPSTCRWSCSRARRHRPGSTSSC